MFVASYRESTCQGLDAFAWEVQLAAQPWGFRLGELRVPVTIWHGTQDNSIPPDMGRAMARAIPGARLCLLEGEGHLFFLSRWHEILLDVLADVPPR